MKNNFKTIKENKNFQDETVPSKDKIRKFLLSNNMSAPMFELKLKIESCRNIYLILLVQEQSLQIF